MARASRGVASVAMTMVVVVVVVALALWGAGVLGWSSLSGVFSDGGEKGPSPRPMPDQQGRPLDGSTPPASPAPGGEQRPGTPPATPAAAERPDVVLVVVDDLSVELVQTMRHAQQMAARGASYRNAFVTDSLCCVSRASILTGQWPHQTGVRTNTSADTEDGVPIGGWAAFQAHGDLRRTFAVRVQRAGYTTGYVGKYLNEYEYEPGGRLPAPPPGWSDLRVVFGSAYDGWDFESSYVEDGMLRLRQHPAPAEDADDAVKDAAYAGTVIADLALDFIAGQAAGAQTDRAQPDLPARATGRGTDPRPWFLEVAPYAAHSRVTAAPHYSGDPTFPPAFRDRPGHGRRLGRCGPVRCTDLTVADLPGFGDDPADNAPLRADGSAAPWRTNQPSLTVRGAERSLRNRARMLQSVDRMLGRILRAVDDDTYVVLTSDNGLHLGQHGLDRSKGTPYDSDARVPLIVVGPGVVPGVRTEVVSTVDLAPTFEELAGLRPARYRAGTSLVPTFTDPTLDRRDVTFLEHTKPTASYGDPDQPFPWDTLKLIPSFVAVRGATDLLVRFDVDPDPDRRDVAWEYYDYTAVRWERTNAWADPAHRDRVRALTARLLAFERCSATTGDEPVSPRCRKVTFRAARPPARGDAGAPG